MEEAHPFSQQGRDALGVSLLSLQFPGKPYTLFGLLLTSHSFLSPPHFFSGPVLCEYPWLNLHCIRVKHFKFLRSRSKSDRLYEAIIAAGILYV